MHARCKRPSCKRGSGSLWGYGPIYSVAWPVRRKQPPLDWKDDWADWKDDEYAEWLDNENRRRAQWGGNEQWEWDEQQPSSELEPPPLGRQESAEAGKGLLLEGLGPDDVEEQIAPSMAMQWDESVGSALPGVSKTQGKKLCRQLGLANKLTVLLDWFDQSEDPFDRLFEENVKPFVQPVTSAPETKRWIQEALDEFARKKARGVDDMLLKVSFIDGRSDLELRVLRKATVSVVKRAIASLTGAGLVGHASGWGMLLYVHSFGEGVAVSDETVMDNPLKADQSLQDLGIADGAVLVALLDASASEGAMFGGVHMCNLKQTRRKKKKKKFNPEFWRAEHKAAVDRARQEQLSSRLQYPYGFPMAASTMFSLQPPPGKNDQPWKLALEPKARWERSVGKMRAGQAKARQPTE
eukprot:g1003.t1